MKKILFVMALIIGIMGTFAVTEWLTEPDCRHTQIEAWELNWINENLVRARDSHQRAYDSGNAYWMPLSAQKEWVVFYDRLTIIMETFK